MVIIIICIAVALLLGMFVADNAIEFIANSAIYFIIFTILATCFKVLVS